MRNSPDSDELGEQLQRLAALRDEHIDLTDIPEITDAQWASAIRGTEFRAARAASRRPDLLRRAEGPLADIGERGPDRPR